MKTHTLRGRCQCGSVEYAVSGAIESFICHCEDCRLNSGAPFVAWGRVLESNFELIKGELKSFTSNPGVDWMFCERCGTSIKYENAESKPYIDFFLATLLEPVGDVEPKYHIQVEEKLSWVQITDNLPQYRRWRHDDA